ncbi:MAG: acyl-CoA dehydrogenase [Deltaproteobacteria bacterium]|nr:acyl-CoA dehydrogenase [Deltaproteobacteria bacterium]
MITLSEEHRMLRAMVREFAEKEIKKESQENDKAHRFPVGLVKRMGELGLMGVAIPEEYGGSGLDNLAYAIAVEEVSRGCAGTSVIMSVNNSLVGDPLLRFGTPEQKQKYLKPLAKGEKIACFMLSEPQSGSDATHQKTTAQKKGHQYILNGTKNFITNGPQADFGIVFAMTDPSQGAKGVSAFIVEKGWKGFRVGSIDEKLGILCSGTSQMHFDNCEVPEENLLGKVGEGIKIAFSTLDGGRIGIGAQALGIAQAAMEAAITYAKERKQFGRAIGDFQAIQWILADMATSLDATRLLVYQAANLKDQGKPYAIAGAKAKLFASEVAMEVTTNAIQVYGGYGYMKDYPLEKYFRDAKITQIYEGTSEVQRIVIARSLLKD